MENMSLSPDGKYLANGGSNPLLWNVSTGEKVYTLGGFPGDPNGLAFTDEGRTLRIGGWENKFRVWDAGTGKEKTPESGN